MSTLGADSTAARPQGYEIIRGQFAGLLAGSTLGTIVALGSSLEPTWHVSTLLAALFGMGMGGFLGVLAGFVGGMTLRLMRSVPVRLASTAAGVAVAVTVSMSLFLLGWTSPSTPDAFPIMGGLIAGIVAAAAAPWIRR